MSTPENRAFHTFVRFKREEAGLTQKQIAQALGFKSVAFISDIESGNRKPSRDLLPKLAAALRVQVVELEARDIRVALDGARELLEAHPESCSSFSRIVKRCADLGPAEVVRRIERKP